MEVLAAERRLRKVRLQHLDFPKQLGDLHVFPMSRERKRVSVGIREWAAVFDKRQMGCAVGAPIATICTLLYP